MLAGSVLICVDLLLLFSFSHITRISIWLHQIGSLVCPISLWTMSVPVHPLLALVDASKNGLKRSLTNYIELQVEKQFAQLRNRIVNMIEDGQIVFMNATVSTQANTTFSNQLITTQPDNEQQPQQQQMDNENPFTNAHIVTVSIKTDPMDCDLEIVKQEFEEDYEDGHDCAGCDRCVVKRELVSDEEEEEDNRFEQVNYEDGVIRGGDHSKVDHAQQAIYPSLDDDQLGQL